MTPNGDLAMGAGEVGIRSGGPPRPAQRLPANQRAPQREERLVDVGPLVIPHAQAAKLTEPRKCALHDPPPPAQATPVRGATHGQQGHNVTSPETAPNGGCVVAAIPEHTVRALPRSSPFAVQRRNRIHQRQGFLRVVPVGAGQAHGERYARPSQIRWRLLPRLARSVGFGTVWSPPYTARMQQLSTTARDQSIWRFCTGS
jgi:hypothetical protein